MKVNHKLVEVVLVGGLTAVGFAVGHDPVVAILESQVGALGINWMSSLAERAFTYWCGEWLKEHGTFGKEISTALSEAFDKAVMALETSWQQQRYYLHLLRRNKDDALETFNVLKGLRHDAINFFQGITSGRIVLDNALIQPLVEQDEKAARSQLKESVSDYLKGYPDELVSFVNERLAAEWLLAFADKLKEDTPTGANARRACEHSWQSSLTKALGQLQAR